MDSSPFLPGRYTSHGMQAIQHPLAAQESLLVKVVRKRAFESRFVFRFTQQRS